MRHGAAGVAARVDRHTGLPRRPDPRPGNFEPRFASTREYMDIVNQVTGQDLDWFFEGYLYQAAIPDLVETREGDRLTVTLDDPASRNAIDRTMRDALHEAFELAALDTRLQVSLRGTGRTFSLGAELAEFGTTTDPVTAHGIRMKTLPARMIARCADRLDVHVQGGCVGAGLEMAAWASRFTASPDAWFQLPELAMGVLPGAGGCVSITRRIGRQLIAHAGRYALSLGVPRVYLSARPSRRSLYEELGWTAIEEGVGDLDFTILTWDATAAGSHPTG